jgi:hypothetical protein
MIAKKRASTAAGARRLRVAWGVSVAAAYLLAAITGVSAGVGAGVDTGTNVDALQETVRFEFYDKWSRYGELASRLLGPFEAARFMARLLASGGNATNQPVDLAAERFLVRVPAGPPPAAGYGLLVFVPPWQEARLPPGWAAVLDSHGLVFVTAARSGNAESIMGRREPLALLAAANIMRRYPVDPKRMYVGGFSGGARVALRLAIGYPDLFHGALLNAGSDIVGDDGADPPIPLPPRELLYQFQESSRLVYVTGERDAESLDLDRSSLRSLAQWCIFDHEAFILPRLEHAVADAPGLARALDALVAPLHADHTRLQACRAGLQAELDARLQRAAGLVAAGQRTEARRLLGEIDRHYGSLAAPRSLELQAAAGAEPAH